MIPVTFNGNPAYLLDDAPNWDNAVTLEATLPNSYERGLTGRETRRATGDTLRLALKWTATLTSDAALTNLRNALQALNVQPVLCPFWPGEFAAGAAPQITAQFYALFNDDGSFNSLAAAAALPFALTAYPLMVGILHDLPDPKLLAMSAANVEFYFAENDNAYFLTPPAFTAPAGIAAASGVRPRFPFRADWTTAPVSAGAEVDIDRQQIGAQRALSQVYFPQRNRRRIKQSFTLQNFDALNLLSFFVSLGGETNSFWLPTALIETTLTADVGAADTALQVAEGAALGGNTFIALDDDYDFALLAVSSVAGNTWNLLAAPGAAFDARTANIESVILARFDALKLTLNFTSPQLAGADLSFKELPWETADVAGETIGTTMGALPATAILFVFTLAVPSGGQTWYFTSYERDLSDGTHTYTSAPMEFDNIIETAQLDRQQLTLTARNFSGNPLALLVPFTLEWPLMLEIIEADVTGNTAGNLRTYFYGEVGDADVESAVIKATCATLSNIFDRNLPRRLYQRTDNWVLFEPANGLLPANWQWNAVVVSYDAPTATLIVNTITSTNGATLVAHWFAAGYCVVTGGGISQARMISDNLAPVAGEMTLYFTSALGTPANPGDTLQLFAGYDMQADTAISKFANYDNFGGFPFMPVGNPTVFRIRQPKGGGKK